MDERVFQEKMLGLLERIATALNEIQIAMLNPAPTFEVTPKGKAVIADLEKRTTLSLKKK